MIWEGRLLDNEQLLSKLPPQAARKAMNLLKATEPGLEPFQLLYYANISKPASAVLRRESADHRARQLLKFLLQASFAAMLIFPYLQGGFVLSRNTTMKFFRKLVWALALGSAFAGSFASTAQGATSWTLRHRVAPPAPSAPLMSPAGLLFGNGMFLALSELSATSATVSLSENGEQWRKYSVPALGGISGMAFGGGRFLAVGDGGSVKISTDGTNWVSGNVGATNALNSIHYANNRFIALSQNAVFVSANSGDTWEQGNAQLPWGLSIAHGSGKYIAVREGLPGLDAQMFVSEDALAWTELARPAGGTDIAFDDGYFLVTTKTRKILKSTDGINWAAIEGLIYATKIVRGEGAWVAAGGASPSETGEIITSLDGTTWTRRSSPVQGQFQHLAYGNGRFAAVSRWDFGIYIAVSDSGIGWRDAAIPAALNAVTYGDAGFVAVGNSGTTAHSTNGATWAEQIVPGIEFKDVCFAQGRCVAVGLGGSIASSTNGTSWALHPSPTSVDLLGVAYGAGRFVAVGNIRSPYDVHQLAAVTSTNGVDWSLAELVFDPRFTDLSMEDVAYGDGVFHAPGYQAYFSSTNGLVWTSKSTGSGYHVAFGNDRRLTLTQNNIATVINGQSSQKVKPSPTVSGIAFGNGIFLLPDAGKVWSSPTGADWEEWAMTSTNQPGGADTLYGAAYGNGTWVTVGANRTIFQSEATVRLANPRLVAEGFRVSVETDTGSTYILEATGALDGSAWQAVSSAAGTGGSVELSAPAVSAPAQFYRVKVE